MKEIGEKCAVFGIYGQNMDVSRLSFFGLYALQHRGQESAGIATSDGEKISCYKGMGLVCSVFHEEAIDNLKGHIAIAHNRYSTSKDSTIDMAHPIIVADGKVALVHNGNLPSVESLTQFLEEKNIKTEGLSDSYLMALALGWYVEQGDTLESAMKKSFKLFTGAFSLIAMTKNQIVAARDQKGIRPLALARLNGGFVFSSETCAFAPIGATFMKEVLPGEMITVDEKGLRFEQIETSDQKLDIFEFIYFARHNSVMLGRSVYEVRKDFGKMLFKESAIEADVVIPVPETAIPMAIGYSQASGIPFEMGLAKNRYIQRTFIEPNQRLREHGVKMKLTPLPEVLKDKRVIVIDDSIVRGTTSKQMIKMLYDAGAKEVHFLVGSPPIRFPDFYGIDIPKQQDLIAFNKNEEEIREFLGVTSLHYLTVDGMIEATGLPRESFNTSCFTGEYSIDIKERAGEFSHPASIEEEKISTI